MYSDYNMSPIVASLYSRDFIWDIEGRQYHFWNLNFHKYDLHSNCITSTMQDNFYCCRD